MAETNDDEIVALDQRYDEVALLHDYQQLDLDGKAVLLHMLRVLRQAPLTPAWEQERPDVVTQTDIAALFRLVLGRNPGQQEWLDHCEAELGQHVDEISRRFLTSLEFNRRSMLKKGYVPKVRA